jgi:hypothetical protein
MKLPNSLFTKFGGRFDNLVADGQRIFDDAKEVPAKEGYIIPLTGREILDEEIARKLA